MNEIFVGLNWPAILLGTVAAFALGMLWYSPKLLGKGWAEGSHGITPPASLPLGAVGLQLLGTFLMAWLIGITARLDALLTAVLIVLAIAVLLTASGFFGQKSRYAALVDGGFVVAMGVVMIAAQGIL